jgi:hypothetical protein
MVKKQVDLWSEGLSVSQMFAKQKALAGGDLEREDDEESSKEDVQTGQIELESGEVSTFGYGGGKWGRYLRAPDFYFQVMRELGHSFTRFGEVATIKRGITSGCDGFFMPRNVSADLLQKNQNDMKWNTLPLMRRCKRADVEKGKLIIIESGVGTLHVIESEFVRPEVHSLMQVDRPIVSPSQLDRVVLWVNQPLSELKGTYVHQYITWGSKQTFASEKSKSVPIPERDTCAARQLWYDLTGSQAGVGFWPKSQQYRHIIPANPGHLICNCNLYDIHSLKADALPTRALMPILNSTLVSFVKPFYGRYAGTEGNLKTEVIDVVLIEIPDPRKVTKSILERLESSFASMQDRKVTHLVEEAFLKCHSAEEVREAEKLPLGLPLELQQSDRRELDDAVFELLGVSDPCRRQELVDQLYREVALHFRSIRIIEVQKMEQRRQGGTGGKVSQMELALDAWNELDPEWQKPISAWLEEQTGKAKVIDLPDGEVRLPEVTNLFEASTLFFGKKPAIAHVCANRAEAELLFDIATSGLRGPVSLPATEPECVKLGESLKGRLAEGKSKLKELAEQRAGTDKLREQVVDVLYRWFIQGRPNDKSKS